MSSTGQSTFDDPVVIVSTDTHIGPRLRADLRPYCPTTRLSEFDEYAAASARYQEAMRQAAPNQYLPFDGSEPRHLRNCRNALTPGHYDMHARLRDLDADGVAAEVIFHGSQNDEPLPFTTLGDPRNSQFFKNLAPEDPELALLGQQMFNNWLADVCSIEPERHLGLAYVPIWDVDAAVRELQRARELGLRAINFPCPQPWLPPYNDRQWEPLWSAATDLGMPLVTHVGGGVNADYVGMTGRIVRLIELPFFGTRAIPWMIFGGVFERHPGLKMVITEIFGDWWPQMTSDLDSAYQYARTPILGEDYSELIERCPRPPSEYCAENIFVGASFMSRTEAARAYADGYYTNYMWGSDYPHAEGTFQYQEQSDGLPVSLLSLRSTFAGIPGHAVRAMLGTNAMDVYGFDSGALHEVAARIGAPTMTDIGLEYVGPPPGVKSLAFRTSRFI
jgi:predicted TIM-barrel fold metal-dependent hydrolase